MLIIEICAQLNYIKLSQRDLGVYFLSSGKLCLMIMTGFAPLHWEQHLPSFGNISNPKMHSCAVKVTLEIPLQTLQSICFHQCYSEHTGQIYI